MIGSFVVLSKSKNCHYFIPSKKVFDYRNVVSEWFVYSAVSIITTEVSHICQPNVFNFETCQTTSINSKNSRIIGINITESYFSNFRHMPSFVQQTLANVRLPTLNSYYFVTFS